MRAATNWLHTILSIHFARIDVKAAGLKSFICFTLSFFGTGITVELFHVRGAYMLSIRTPETDGQTMVLALVSTF